MWFAQWEYESSHGLHGTYEIFETKPDERLFGCMCIPGSMRMIELPSELDGVPEKVAKEYFDSCWIKRWHMRRKYRKPNEHNR